MRFIEDSYPSPKDDDENPLDLARLYRVPLRHKTIILAVLSLVVGATTLVTLQIKPVFRATSIIEISESRHISPLTGQFMYWEGYLANAFYFQTHFKLLTSRPVLERVIEKLELKQNEIEMEKTSWRTFFSRIKQNFYLLLGRKESQPPVSRDIEPLVGILKSKIRVGQIKDTRLITISVEDHAPELARDISNALARAYIEYNSSNRVQYSVNTLSWMTDKLSEIKKKLESAEDKFLTFKQQNDVLFTVKGKQKKIEEELAKLRVELTDIRNRERELAGRLDKLRRIQNGVEDISTIHMLTDNQLVINRYEELARHLSERLRIEKIYKPKHPKMIELNARIEYAQKSLLAIIAREVDALQSELDRLPESEKLLSQKVNSLESQAIGTNRNGLEYSSLQRNVEMQQKMYDIVLNKLNEADIVGNIDTSNVRMAERATVPREPIRPNKQKNVVQSVIIGLILAIGLSFLLEQLDQSLRTEEDVHNYLGIPVLSVIPIAQKGHDMSGKKAGSSMQQSQ